MKKTYKELVDREMAKWEALLELLRAEQLALTHGDISDLNTMINTKLELVRVLDKMTEEREEWKSENTLDSGSINTEKVLTKLRDMARTLNQQNGTLIDRRLYSVRKAIDILLGSASKQNVYTQDGQMTIRAAYQPLTAA